MSRKIIPQFSVWHRSIFAQSKLFYKILSLFEKCSSILRFQFTQNIWYIRNTWEGGNGKKLQNWIRNRTFFLFSGTLWIDILCIVGMLLGRYIVHTWNPYGKLLWHGGRQVLDVKTEILILRDLCPKCGGKKIPSISK